MLADVERALRRAPDAVARPQTMLDAARARRPDVLALLLDRGGDPNAIYRGYRPLHSLLQREPHADPEELSAERSGPRSARLLLARVLTRRASASGRC